MRRSEAAEPIEEFLADCVTYRFNWKSRHPRVEIFDPRAGRNVYVSFSLTTSNRNAPYDTVTRLRRALSLNGSAR
jgi:hypothetical protein